MGGGGLLRLASGYRTLYPSPTTRGYHGDDPFFPTGPVVSSRASFTFFFCFSSIFSLPYSHILNPSLSHKHRSFLKAASYKVGRVLSQGRRRAPGWGEGSVEGESQREGGESRGTVGRPEQAEDGSCCRGEAWRGKDVSTEGNSGVMGMRSRGGVGSEGAAGVICKVIVGS